MPAPTIFNRLDDAGISWKVYFDEMQLVSLTGVQHAPSLEKYWRTEHFGHMSEFYEDAKAGTLPAYAFIEPRMVYNHNDFHPPFGVFRSSDVDGETILDSAVSDVRAGEKLVASVYDAIKSQRHGGRLERDEHAAAHHFRRARRHVRSRPPAERDAPDRRRRTRRDGIHVRSARLPGSRDRRVGVHAGEHDHPRRDAPRLRDRHAVAAARAPAAHAAGCGGERPVLRGQPRSAP